VDDFASALAGCVLVPSGKSHQRGCRPASLWHDWAIAGDYSGHQFREPVERFEREQNRLSPLAAANSNDLGHYSLRELVGDVRFNLIIPVRTVKIATTTQGNLIENH